MTSKANELQLLLWICQWESGYGVEFISEGQSWEKMNQTLPAKNILQDEKIVCGHAAVIC